MLYEVITSTFNEICKAINEADVRDYFSINKTDMVITAHTGNQMLFAGLDDVEKIKSITPAKGVLTDVWIEEATETDGADVKQLNKRLRGKADVPKRVILSFNPILQTHWIYEEYFSNWEEDKWQYQDDDLLILKTIYKHNSYNFV